MQPSIQSESNPSPHSNFDLNLEGLRGFAALSVGYSHIFGFKNFLDPSYHPGAYLNYLQAAHAAVLIFFMLSGYLIGLTNSQIKFSLQKVKLYLIRRGIRLIPIYWITIIFSVLVTPKNNWQDILGNCVFLQILIFKPIQNNTVLWSLNYEVFYYLLFLLIWWLKPKLISVVISCLVISTIGWILPVFPQLLHSYAAGWVFWLIGLGLAWNIQPISKKFTQIPLFSYVLLLTATNNLSLGKLILNGLGFKNQYVPIVNLSDLALLPICLVIIATITKRQLLGWKWLQIICFAIPLIGIIFLLLIGRLFENPWWTTSAIFTVAAIILWRFKTDVKLLANLAGIGRISYAFYILHMPVMQLIHDHFPYQGTSWSFVIRLLVWFATTIGASMLLELVMQPAIKQFLSKRLLANAY
jgi:peptidoglycan/LPS O-acetylase OafA/YrhL